MEGKKRLEFIDTYRGITIISMILFHACWIFSFFGLLMPAENINTPAFIIWERTICCSFIFISGFSFSLGKKHLKNGILILGLGVAITILSVLFAYEIRDIFGVLWLLGFSQLFMIIPDKYTDRKQTITQKQAIIGLAISLFIFIFTFNINRGYLGLKSIYPIMLPASLYSGRPYFFNFLGFLQEGFYSVDYFTIVPWLFLYVTGYFAQKIIRGTEFEKNILTKGIAPFSILGRHSLLIYLIHPPVLAGIAYLITILK